MFNVLWTYMYIPVGYLNICGHNKRRLEYRLPLSANCNQTNAV